MDMGKEVYAQKTDFIRLFWEKVVSDVSRWAWHTREQVINRKKPIFLKLALKIYFNSKRSLYIYIVVLMILWAVMICAILCNNFSGILILKNAVENSV
jgi:hypothetical protein